jgi:parallel beta-helix repeat protein
MNRRDAAHRMHLPARGLVLVALAALVAGALALAAPASAGHVQCGDTLTQDTKLDADLNCSGSGLVVGADGITLDLNGHTITGERQGSGILVQNRHEVSVQGSGGAVRDFTRGVVILGGGDNAVQRVAASGSSNEGILVANSTGNTLQRNDTSENFRDGITLLNSHSNTVQRNRAVDSEAGQGILLTGAHNNLVQRNEASGSDLHNGILLTGANNNVLQRNEASDNNGDGILVAANSAGTLLQRNQADRNGDDGIDVDNADTTIFANTANDNGDLGIEAVAGVKDGGLNSAAGNGNPQECTNVVCS